MLLFSMMLLVWLLLPQVPDWRWMLERGRLVERGEDGRPLRTREVMRAMRAHGGPGPGG